MYLYFDRTGTLKEIINGESIRQGSANANAIYAYFEEEPTSATFMIEFSNGDRSNEYSMEKSGGEIYLPAGDYRYFKEDLAYSFWSYALSAEDLLVDGLAKATVRAFVNSQIHAQGLVTFNVESSVIQADPDITVSQYDYLLGYVNNAISSIPNTYVKKSGDAMTGGLEAPYFETRGSYRVRLSGEDGLEIIGSGGSLELLNGRMAVPESFYFDTPNGSFDFPEQDGTLQTAATDARKIVLTLDNQTFKLRAEIRTSYNELIGQSEEIDLPLESTVVGGSYDNQTKSLILTLQSGSTISVPVGDLISGLASEEQVNAKLDKSSSAGTVYAVSPLGEQEMIPYSFTPVSGSIVRRSGGQIKVEAYPIDSDDAASKYYVDSKTSEIASLKERVTELETLVYNSIVSYETVSYSSPFQVVSANSYPIISGSFAQTNKVGGASAVENGQIISKKVDSIKSYGFASVDLGSADNIYPPASTSQHPRTRVRFRSGTLPKQVSDTAILPMRCEIYQPATASQTYEGQTDNIISIMSGGTDGDFSFYIYDTDFIGKTEAEVKQMLNGVILYYQPSNYADGEVLGTYTIPSSITSLEGYGEGINSACYNVLDFENKKYVKKIGKYTFTGNETWIDYIGSGTSLSTTIDGMAGNVDRTKVCNALWALGTAKSYSAFTSGSAEYDIAIYNGRLYVWTSKTQAELRTALTGKTIQFELATYEETDLSSVLGDAPKLEIERYGYLDATAQENAELATPMESVFAVYKPIQ